MFELNNITMNKSIKEMSMREIEEQIEVCEKQDSVVERDRFYLELLKEAKAKRKK